MRLIARLSLVSLKKLAIFVHIFILAGVLFPAGARADMPSQDKALTVPGIKGKDNRVRVRIAEDPWRTIGRLNRNGSHCTGILVGPSLVLTAAHCFWDTRRNKWSVPSAFHFVLGYEKGVVKAHSKIESFELSDGRQPVQSTRKPAPEADWAIARLEEPLGNKFGFARPADLNLLDLKDRLSKGAVVVQAGYSRDIAHILTADEDCEINNLVQSKSGFVLLHQCDATQGDSGSPLFLKIGQSYTLLGIHVATLTLSNGASEGIAVSVQMFGERISKLTK
ncbi:trypsin-like serine peptidase [Sneathiella litorea]|uniref:Trypsin-like serine protease n=1 Tax=Sneathiella litorea TaxID=2606216 RepID=A0A6L8W852_9PROT|nr:trypsin-like serine protease [Sneathiella litorea]MZR31296.1 trypsin-like serine protease [Sneathiella litorea]